MKFNVFLQTEVEIDCPEDISYDDDKYLKARDEAENKVSTALRESFDHHKLVFEIFEVEEVFED